VFGVWSTENSITEAVTTLFIRLFIQPSTRPLHLMLDPKVNFCETEAIYTQFCSTSPFPGSYSQVRLLQIGESPKVSKLLGIVVAEVLQAGFPSNSIKTLNDDGWKLKL